RQGGVVKIPVRFTSSAMRARFNPRDGQLYVAGLRGWQSNAAREGGFDRVRYTGAPAVLPTTLRATKTGVVVGFTAPLDAATASDPERYAVEAWNYKWSSGYGSGEFPIRAEDGNTKGEGRSTWTARSATVSADGRSVTLEIPEIQPVMQMRIQMKIKAADGSPVSTEIHSTLHRLR
ncbi:MAG TPA: hypothetical protein VEJ18_12675, partial [Planctomycetota bacterium]|nr:hypothetical protein [Planctomycetota bacterium]